MDIFLNVSLKILNVRIFFLKTFTHVINLLHDDLRKANILFILSEFFRSGTLDSLLNESLKGLANPVKFSHLKAQGEFIFNK